VADSLDKQIARHAKKLRKIARIEVPRANARALNTVAKRTESRSARGISKETRIPQKTIRNRIAIAKATARKQYARIKHYVRPISAVQLLTKSQIQNKLGTGTNRKGVRAKGYQFAGAFIQKGAGGNIHVFQRKGSARLPIEVVNIPIDKQARRIVETVSRRVMKNDYPQLLASDLQARYRRIKTGSF
jgi:hypothetical protein